MYKEIIIDRVLSPADLAAAAAFNQRVDRKFMYLQPNGNTLSLFLRQANLVEIEAMLNRDLPAEVLFEVLQAIKNIKSYGLKAGYRVYVDYNRERKVKQRAQKEQKRHKHYYAAQHDFSPDNNPPDAAYVDKIVCGDSQDVLANLADNSVDLIVTSPPYNFGLDYANAAADDSFWQQYFDTLFSIFAEGIRVLKFGGRFIVNIQPLYSDYIPSHHIISHYFMTQKMIWKGEIIWEKNNYNCKYSAWGSWKSPSNPYLKGTWEFLEIYCKGSLKKTGNREDIDIDAEEFKKWVVARWSIAPERKMRDYGHPAMFPEKLVERVLKLFSYRGDFVVDPFNGAGTTSVVAKRLDRHYLGIDISEQYCTTARTRLAAAALHSLH